MEPVVQPPRPPRVRPWQVGLLVALGFAGMLGVGLAPRLGRQHDLADAAEAAASRAPLVVVAKAEATAGAASLDLPGEIKAYQEAALFARASGYLKRRYVDIGDRVKAGQPLADIESPELDKELGQARAALAQAEARLEEVRTAHALAATTATRWKNLRKDGSVSPQEADEKQAAYRAKGAEVHAVTASVRAARQNVQRLEALTAYQRVIAPFSGTITARGVDPGALIAPGGGANGAPLFRLVQADRLRIALNVPQTFAPAIRKGAPVQVLVRELGNKPYAGQVVRTAGALDPATRTLLTEVELPNDGKLMPGMYARARMDVDRAVPAVVVPGTAVVTRGGENQVAVVGFGAKIHYRKVQITRDDGTKVEVSEGLKAGDTVVIGPSDAIGEGTTVEIAKPAS